jgi:hypothetical protein
MISINLQIFGILYIRAGSEAITKPGIYVPEEYKSGEFDLWYKRRNSKVSVTALKNLRKEAYKHLSFL